MIYVSSSVHNSVTLLHYLKNIYNIGLTCLVKVCRYFVTLHFFFTSFEWFVKFLSSGNRRHLFSLLIIFRGPILINFMFSPKGFLKTKYNGTLWFSAIKGSIVLTFFYYPHHFSIINKSQFQKLENKTTIHSRSAPITPSYQVHNFFFLKTKTKMYKFIKISKRIEMKYISFNVIVD